jgi:hypothetical protein
MLTNQIKRVQVIVTVIVALTTGHPQPTAANDAGTSPVIVIVQFTSLRVFFQALNV